MKTKPKQRGLIKVFWNAGAEQYLHINLACMGHHTSHNKAIKS
jgi:hypothetical protein